MDPQRTARRLPDALREHPLKDQRCGATWWHAEERAGQRVVIHHTCGKYTNAQHGDWHTCTSHGAPERMSRSAQRVTSGS